MKTNMVIMKATTLKMAIRLAKKSGLGYCAIIKKEGEYEIDPTVGLDKKGARAALIKGKLWKRVVEEIEDGKNNKKELLREKSKG